MKNYIKEKGNSSKKWSGRERALGGVAAL